MSTDPDRRVTRTPFDRVNAYIKAYRREHAADTMHDMATEDGAEFLAVSDILAVLKLAAPHANTGPHEPGALHRLLLFVRAHEAMYGAQPVAVTAGPEEGRGRVLSVADLKALLALAVAASTLDHTTIEGHMDRLGWQRKAD